MHKQICGTVLASFAAAAVLHAQSPAEPGRTSQPTDQPQPAYEQQLVTVEGCLRRERASDEAAIDLAADPMSNVIFLLVNAEPRSRTDTVGEAGGAADDRVLGPAGVENERVGVPVDRGTTQQPGQPDQPASPAIEGSRTPAADRYVVVGLDDDRLKPFAGQRVEMRGQFDPPAAGSTHDAGDRPPAGTSGTAGAPLTLPQFRATSVKPVPGICPPKP